MEVFSSIQASDLSRDDARDLIRAAFMDLAAKVQDGFVPSSDYADLEIFEQEEMAKERIEELCHSLRHREFDGRTSAVATQAASSRGISLDALPIARRLDVLEHRAFNRTHSQRR